MKRTIIILGTIIAIATAAIAQKEIADKTWTNGDCEYHVLQEGNTLIFSGFDRHEGGFGFALDKQANGKMVISQMQKDDVSYYCFEQYLASTMEYKVLNGQEVLLVKNNKDALVDVFINDNLNDMLTSSAVCYLAGSYSDADGKKYTFSADAPRANGFGKTEQYNVVALYYLPGLLISFGDSNPYLVTGDSRSSVNELRLLLQPCIENGEGDWEPQTTGQLELLKTNWSSAVDKNISGRYPYASARVMTRGELMLFSNDELDIMRNEIFARRGHIFKTTRYRDHFEANPWYKGTVNDATGLLSEIERLNIEQIVATQQIIRNAN